MEESSQSSLSTLLETIQTSLSSAAASLPTSKTVDHETQPDEASIIPPAEGISLLDTKSEVLLSYLQNLVFLILLQVRQLSTPPQQNDSEDGEDDAQIQDEVTQKLVELRVYLERGARPLEGRLKYQIDKVLRAAEDTERRQQQTDKKPKKPTSTKQKNRRSDGEGSDSDSEEVSGSQGSDEGENEDADVDELAYRPNLAAFSRKSQEEAKPKESAKSAGTDGVYRPPKIKPTALAEPADTDRRKDREARANRKSRVMDEFVETEMSAAPAVEYSVGSTIRAGGRDVRTRHDRKKETERRDYEETNFVRLPGESKKEKAKKKVNRPAGFGGEEWRGLGEGADRIERLTRRGKEGGGALERSRKRPATEDGPRLDGAGVGESFEKRRKKVAGWKR